ncbi:MAG TPA: DUF6174 domain-containing protein [Longimicrobium sp.]|jgi:hypothetical protein|uniref:DUF6174 domain-containing protein n=1 Tax=Longimicrobium sp. TaxID=2029185 RepID=UPI002ED9313A
MKILTPLLLALALSGCARPFLLPRDEEGEVAAQRRRWESHDLDDYRFTFARDCFCAPLGVVVVEVRDDKVVSVKELQTGNPVTGTTAQQIPTIEQLFGYIARAADEGTYLEVEYHSSLGYPAAAEIGTLANDAGARYSVGNVQRVR